MRGNILLKGVFLVGLGATSYGMLATFVKLAYKENYTTAEVTIAQFVLGILGVGLLRYREIFMKKKNNITLTPKLKMQLMMAGTSLGATSVFYYLCVKYIDVSIAIVLLMQTVWIGVLLEWLIDKVRPSIQKITAVFIVLFGTLLATNAIASNVELDWRGLFWGLLAAASFSVTMLTANKVALGVSSTRRSLYMLYGGAVVVLIFALMTQQTPFHYEIFLKWGMLIALFGTIIPPILMNSGFPLTGIGLGSIVSSLELPVSVTMAYLLLNEQVLLIQWFGIFLILGAIVIMNLKFKS